MTTYILLILLFHTMYVGEKLVSTDWSFSNTSFIVFLMYVPVYGTALGWF